MRVKLTAGLATIASLLALWTVAGDELRGDDSATRTPTPIAAAAGTPTLPPTRRDCLASDECYPKPRNSGAGATGIPVGHSPAQGCSTSPPSGAVLEDCLFTGTATITTTGHGATYRFARFEGQVDHSGAGMLRIEYSTFGPASSCQSYDNSITGGNYTVRYSRFNQHVSEGPRVSDSNILIEDNFIGPMCANPGDHSDGIQGFGGGKKIVIRHNTITQSRENVTAPIFIADKSQSADVRYNLVSGGGYSLRLHDDFTPDHGPWVLIGNRIVAGAWHFGPMSNSGTRFTHETCKDNRLVDVNENYEITKRRRVIGC